ncbi:MAG: RNA polymerase sigma factor [Acidimicrobiales bacterium]
MAVVFCDDVDVDVDADLAARCVTGDTEAFADLYRRYQARLHRVCARRLRDPHEASDAVQETFARAWRALPRYDGSWRLYPWLRTIAGNVCTDVIRRRMRVELSALEDWHGGTFDPVDAHVNALDAKRTLSELATVIEELPERYRQTLLLHEVQGLSSRQIASEHGTSVRAVETVLLRTRRILRSAVEQPAFGIVAVVGRVLRLSVRGHAIPARALTGARLGRVLRTGRVATTGVIVSGALSLAVLGVIAPGHVPPGFDTRTGNGHGLVQPADTTEPATSQSNDVPASAGAVSSAAGHGPNTPAVVHHRAVQIDSAHSADNTASHEPSHTAALGLHVGTDLPEAAQQTAGHAGDYVGQVIGTATRH